MRKSMEVKAVFFDIDGTLVNDSRTVLKSTEAAIKSLKEQGILVGLATGRGPFFVKPFMDKLAGPLRKGTHTKSHNF